MDTTKSSESRHPIRVVSKRTGLTPALLRAWEKRYEVVVPHRTEGGQRLYSDDDVHRLALLNKVVEEGRSISQVAALSREELEALVQEDRVERVTAPVPKALRGLSVGNLLEESDRAVAEMDAPHLERILTRGAMALPVSVLTDDVLMPLLARIGSNWEDGTLGAAQEHLASRVIRRVLEWLLATVAVEEDAPVLVTATPAGEPHEFGALLSAVAAAGEGWRGIFLGPDLPANEIAGAAIRLRAKAVALSLVNPDMVEGWEWEVGDLRDRLPPSVRLFVGGPENSVRVLEGSHQGIQGMRNFTELRGELRRR
jgi:DNA-binding transcriptional MerR regulator